MKLFIEANAKALEYKDLFPSLRQLLHLSDSRLSHLFSEAMQVSLKEYYLWTKLKGSTQDYLESSTSFLGPSLDNGFYDQAHFSKTFKRFMGVSPSSQYNSRNVQSK
ncbi:MAG: helix-turn-helix domain-containing protein [Bacteroidota bacterium]